MTTNTTISIGTLLQAMRDLAHWLYVTLRNEAEYLLSDEAVDESIRVNEYEFTAEGELI